MNLTPLCKQTVLHSNGLYSCIKCNQVGVKKEKRGYEGSKQFTSNYTAAIEALKFGIGSAKHFVQSSKDGEEANAGNTNYTYIQEFFAAT